jgi:hypothetical protein
MPTLGERQSAPGLLPDDDILDSPEVVAAELGTALSTLQMWRSKKRGPPYVKVTARIIAYPRAARKAWLRERIVDPCAQAREPVSEPSGTDQHT